MRLFPPCSLRSLLVDFLGLVGSNKYKHLKPPACMVFHPVLFSSWSHRTLSRTKYPLLSADLKCSLPLQNNINLVLMAMDMTFLFLAWLETIDITEESIRLEDVILLHLLTAELVKIGKRDNIHHKRSTG